MSKRFYKTLVDRARPVSCRNLSSGGGVMRLSEVKLFEPIALDSGIPASSWTIPIGFESRVRIWRHLPIMRDAEDSILAELGEH